MSARPPASARSAQAVKDRTAAEAEAAPVTAGQGAPEPRLPTGAGVHKPAAALGAMAEGLRERVARLEAATCPGQRPERGAGARTRSGPLRRQ